MPTETTWVYITVTEALTNQSRQILTLDTTHAVLSECSLAKTMSTGMKIRVWTFSFLLMMVRGGGGGWGREGDGRPLVSWLGRIRAVWDRSDLTQPSFSRTGHVRLDLSHTTDIIPLSGETTAHHHSTAGRGEREGKEAIEEEKARKKGRWFRKQ